VVTPSRLSPISFLPLSCANFSFSCRPDELSELTNIQQPSSLSYLPLSQSSVRRNRGSDHPFPRHATASSHCQFATFDAAFVEGRSPRSRVIVNINRVSSLTKRRPVITLSQRCWLVPPPHQNGFDFLVIAIRPAPLQRVRHGTS
jgi:hypothetical protein